MTVLNLVLRDFFYFFSSLPRPDPLRCDPCRINALEGALRSGEATADGADTASTKNAQLPAKAPDAASAQHAKAAASGKPFLAAGLKLMDVDIKKAFADVNARITALESSVAGLDELRAAASGAGEAADSTAAAKLLLKHEKLLLPLAAQLDVEDKHELEGRTKEQEAHISQLEAELDAAYCEAETAEAKRNALLEDEEGLENISRLWNTVHELEDSKEAAEAELQQLKDRLLETNKDTGARVDAAVVSRVSELEAWVKSAQEWADKADEDLQELKGSIEEMKALADSDSEMEELQQLLESKVKSWQEAFEARQRRIEGTETEQLRLKASLAEMRGRVESLEAKQQRDNPHGRGGVGMRAKIQRQWVQHDDLRLELECMEWNAKAVEEDTDEPEPEGLLVRVLNAVDSLDALDQRLDLLGDQQCSGSKEEQSMDDLAFAEEGAHKQSTSGEDDATTSLAEDMDELESRLSKLRANLEDLEAEAESTATKGEAEGFDHRLAELERSQRDLCSRVQDLEAISQDSDNEVEDDISDRVTDLEVGLTALENRLADVEAEQLEESDSEEESNLQSLITVMEAEAEAESPISDANSHVAAWVHADEDGIIGAKSPPNDGCASVQAVDESVMAAAAAANAAEVAFDDATDCPLCNGQASVQPADTPATAHIKEEEMAAQRSKEDAASMAASQKQEAGLPWKLVPKPELPGSSAEPLERDFVGIQWVCTDYEDSAKGTRRSSIFSTK